MIRGIGTDIIELSRIKEAMENPRFAERIFTEKERASIQKAGVSRAAGIFAAKEACSKALGTGFGPIGWQEIELSHTEAGAPIITLHGKALLQLKKIGARKVWVSISHNEGHAVAQVVVEDA